jgi:hypothetical protein
MSDDPHSRFQAWLLGAPRGDPARDLALHASVCPECTRWVAAQDALTAIDLGRARMPPWRSTRPRLGAALRVARLVAVTASLVLLGWGIAFGARQLTAGPASGDRSGQVLSATGRPGASISPSPR